MIDVDVKQYMCPDGQMKQVTAQLPDQYIDAYNDMLDHGFWFEAEVLHLQSSQVAISIANDVSDVDSVLVDNEPSVTGAMEDMLLRGWWRNVFPRHLRLK